MLTATFPPFFSAKNFTDTDFPVAPDRSANLALLPPTLILVAPVTLKLNGIPLAAVTTTSFLSASTVCSVPESISGFAAAAFAKPEIYEALEERGVKYTIRIPANENLERDVAELLPRPVGRPSIKPLVEYKGFLYQAAS